MNSDNKLISIFGSVEDPRSHINQLHDLVDRSEERRVGKECSS